MKKNSINLLLGIFLGIIFLLLWFKMIDWQEFASFFQQFDLWAVVLFSAFYVLAYFLRSLRWRLILQPITNLQPHTSFFIFMTGLMINYLIPIRAGELTKSFILKVRRDIPVSKSLPTVFIDKLSDLFPILLILLLIPLISVRLNQTLYIIIILLFAIFLLLLIFLIFAVHHQIAALRFLGIILKICPSKLRTKINLFFQNFVAGMSVMQGRFRHTLGLGLLTLAAVLCEAIYIYAVFQAFGAEISYSKILFGYTLMNLTYILPTPPAQVGSNQFMWVLIFSFALGVDKNLTAAAVTFSHLLTSIWIFLIGAISLANLKIKFSDLLPKFK
ncbi:MAG: lysylphosphatidylglycerol synthase transmembrane domain-containing protein [Candidatus Cloacimonadales bacterium]